MPGAAAEPSPGSDRSEWLHNRPGRRASGLHAPFGRHARNGAGRAGLPVDILHYYYVWSGLCMCVLKRILMLNQHILSVNRL